jgi:hypothetical protein
MNNDNVATLMATDLQAKSIQNEGGHPQVVSLATTK